MKLEAVNAQVNNRVASESKDVSLVGDSKQFMSITLSFLHPAENNVVPAF
jgi:hypothetical protein